MVFCRTVLKMNTLLSVSVNEKVWNDCLEIGLKVLQHQVDFFKTAYITEHILILKYDKNYSEL